MNSNEENNKKIDKLKVLLLIAIVLGAAIKIAVYVLKNYYGTYVLLKDRFLLDYLLNMILLISISILILQYVQKRWKKLFIVIFMSIILIFYSFLHVLFTADTRFFYFQSPINDTILVVEEDAFLLGGWSNFFIKKKFMFIKDLETCITTDDGYRPFTNKDYKITWIDEKTVKIDYGYGSNHIVKSEIIRLNE